MFYDSIVNGLYKTPLQDADIIRGNIYKFSAYIEMKMLNETMDFNNFNLYEDYQSKVDRILKDSKPVNKDEKPLYMVEGTNIRQIMRKMDPEVVPCPSKQLNALTNANGFPSSDRKRVV